MRMLAFAKHMIAAIVVVFGLAGIGSVAVHTSAQEATPAMETMVPPDGGAAELDEALKEGLMAGDVDAIAELYADNAVEQGPWGTFVGKEEVVGFGEDFLTNDSGFEYEFTETQVVNTTAMHTMELSTDSIREAGVDRIVIHHTLVAQDGHIVSLTAVLDMTDEQTVQYAEVLAQRGAM